MSKSAHTLRVIDGKDLDPVRWDAFVEASPQGSLFVRHAYASAVAPGWQVALWGNGENWLAAMPFFSTKKWGFSIQWQPPFCQCWGICFAPETDLPRAEQWSNKKASIEAFLPLLSKYTWLQVHFAPEFDYVFPLRQAGFSVAPRITYRISLLQNQEAIEKEFAPALVRQLRKARKLGVQVVPAEAKDLIASYGHQLAAGKTLLGGTSTRLDRWENLVHALTSSSTADIFSVTTPDGEVLTTGWFGRHGDKVYFLGGAAAIGAVHSYASPLLLAHALAHYRKAGFSVFDFEGSMLPGVERFFRQFGGIPTPYWEVTHKRKWLRLLELFR